MKLTQKLSKQSFYMGMIVLLPTYLLFGVYIVSALFQFLMNTFHIQLSSSDLNAYYNFFFDLIFACFAIIVFRKELKKQFNHLKEQDTMDFIHQVLLGIPVLYGASFVGSLLSMVLTGDMSSSENQILIEEMMKQVPVIMIISVTVLAPILEELIFRLLLFTGFYKWGRWAGYLIAGGLFGFLHVYQPILQGNFMEILQIFPYLFMGLGLCFVYEKADNIFAPILCHAIMNGISVITIMFM